MIKRIFTIIGIILAILITLGIVGGVLIYTGVIDLSKPNKQNVYVHETDDGLVYTEAEWDWKPIEFRGKINYVDSADVPTRSVNLHLVDDAYYTIKLPDVDYIYDYGKTLWAVDGSYMIRIVGGANINNLSSLAGIDNGEAINKITLCTQDDSKGARTIVTLVDKYAIIAKVYSGDTVYSILRDSLANNHDVLKPNEVSYADDYIELEKLSYSGKFVGQVVFQDISLVQDKYLFEDGALYVSSNLDKLSETKDTYLKRLCMASQKDIEKTYSASGMFYAESGNYHLGLVSYNTNTTIVLFGNGEEAKCNIITIMHYLE